jgi:molybdenum cofactor guanylyltransferase
MALNGLVICGGQSSRMGRDKGLIDYHGKPQRYFLYKMIQPLCDQVFISCSQNQAGEIPPQFRSIADSEIQKNKGPMTGLLSATDLFPEISWLVIACDYPLIEPGDIRLLVERFKETNRSVAYAISDQPEPLLALYHADDLAVLRKNPLKFSDSLRLFLKEKEALLLPHPEPSRITSVDTPEAAEETKHYLKEKGN